MVLNPTCTFDVHEIESTKKKKKNKKKTDGFDTLRRLLN